MKKVITPVGLSIFQNYFQESEDYKEVYEHLDGKAFSEWDNYRKTTSSLKKSVFSWSKGKHHASAEIKSLLKISNYYKQEKEIEVFLLASDSILSVLAAEIIKEWFEEYGGFLIDFDMVEGKGIIDGLQIEDDYLFRTKAMKNLIRRVEEISDGYYGNVIFNITGGYKATVPYLTLMAQVNGAVTHYIFENTDALITIPLLPLDIDWKLFEDNWHLFLQLEDGIANWLKFQSKHPKLNEKIKDLIEVVDNFAMLSGIGQIFWNRYKSRFAFYYAIPAVWEKIKKDKGLKRLIKQKLWNEELRKVKTEIKNNHKVWDDGDNQLRVLYFVKGEKIYIYEAFTEHDRYEKFLEKPFREPPLENFQVYRVEKE